MTVEFGTYLEWLRFCWPSSHFWYAKQVTTPSGAKRAATLFRSEVMGPARSGWLGPTQLVQPLSIRLVSAITVFLLILVMSFAWLGTYTRRVHATGVVLPTAGLITVASAAAGVVSTVAVREGDHVEKDALLYVINLDTNSSSGATEQRVIAELQRQRANLQKQRDIRESLARVEKQGLIAQRANLQKQNDELTQQIA